MVGWGNSVTDHAAPALTPRTPPPARGPPADQTLRRRDRLFAGRTSGWLTVVLALFAVTILLLSPLPLANQFHPGSTSSLPRPANSYPRTGVNPPYVVNATQYPTPVTLPGTSDHTSLPQLQSVSTGYTRVWALLYVDTDAVGNNWLMFRTGVYNATDAQTLASYPGCAPACGPSIPFQWSAPSVVYEFGNVPVTSDAMSASGNLAVVAASSQNLTYVWLSVELGASGSWQPVSGSGGIPGGDGKVAMAACGGILVTTITTTHLIATTYGGGGCGPYSKMGEQDHGVARSASVRPSVGPPTVTGVSPYCSAAHVTVNITGTGYAATGTHAYFGGVAAPTTYVSSTKVTAPAPTGLTGTVDVTVSVAGQSSPLNPPFDWFTLSPPTPCVTGITPANGPVGTTVTVTGLGFASGDHAQFGSTPASSVTFRSPTQLLVVAPPGVAGAVPITVASPSGATSPQVTADVFTFAPTVTGLSPTSALPFSTVKITGTSFTSGSTVSFGSTAALSVQYVSQTTLNAEDPLGSGTVDVKVTASGLTSATNSHDRFTFITPPPPTVRLIAPALAPTGTVVTVFGTNFYPSATVSFGGQPAAGVQVLSGTELRAVAPSNGGTVDIIVTVFGVPSTPTASDRFTYPPATVTRVTPDIGFAGQQVSVLGTWFSANDVVYFGPNASATRYVSPSELLATATSGAGQVPVTVHINGVVTVVTPFSQFTYQTYQRGLPYNQSVLPLAYDAAPAWVTNTTGFTYNLPTAIILASNAANATMLLYRGGPILYHVHAISQINLGGGTVGATFDGASLTVLPGGIPGQVALATEGSYILAAYTTHLGSRMALQTLQSANAGWNWNVTYADEPAAGILADPQVSASPAGDFYGAWLDNGPGLWKVDLAVLSTSGYPVTNLTSVPGGGGSNSTNAGPPSVAVDELQRPMVAWSTYLGNSSANSSISITGQFLSPKAVASLIQQNVLALPATDFLAVQAPLLQSWRQNLNASLAQVVGDLAGGQVCPAESIFLVQVDSNLSPSLAYPLYNASPSLCGTLGPFALHYWPSDIAGELGPGAVAYYLSIYAQWLLEAFGYGLLPLPTWEGAPGGPPIPVGTAGPPNLHQTKSAFKLDQWGDQLAVHPLVLNPNSVWLNTTGSFATFYANSTTSCTTNGYKYSITSQVIDSPQTYITNATLSYVGGIDPYPQPSVNYSGTGPSIQSPYLVNVSYKSWGGWDLTVFASYQATLVYSDGCLGNTTTKPIPIPAGMAHSHSIHVGSTWDTELYFLPSQPPMLISTPDPSNPNGLMTTAAWNNSQEATASASTVNTVTNQVTGTGSVPGFRINENLSVPGTTQPGSYATTITITSQNGGTNGSWSPLLNGMEQGEGAANFSTSATCTYNMVSNPVKMDWYPSTYISAITATSADLTWYGNSQGSGFASYVEGGGAPETQSANVFAPTSGAPNGYPFEYNVQLDDLMPWGFYNVSVSIVVPDTGCHEYTNSALWSFNTTADFPLTEQDLPVDSVSRSGGGAQLSWDVPFDLLFTSGVKFQSAWILLTNESSPTTPLQIQLTTSPPMTGYTSFEYNFTPNPNTDYAVKMEINYTLGQSVYHGFSDPFSFWYEKDSSGDGLTDWEKRDGWAVTTQGVTGKYSSQNVTADPSLYATNGLVSDFVEKQFGLNPTTLDSAGSHMLDTWNLTFDLGANSSNPSLPTGFETWNEVPWYNFSTWCAYPGEPTGQCAGRITHTIASEPSNLSDNSPWAAQVLWSSSALTTLSNLISSDNVGWLRAVLGTTDVTGSSGKVLERTLTVWGKLSWGADPLAASTPLDGIADGARLSPLETVQLQLTQLNAYLGSSVCTAYTPGSGGSNGWAVQLYLNDTDSSSTSEVANYTTPSNITSSGVCNTVGSYTVTVPIDNTQQFQHLDVRVIVNNSGTLVAIPFTSSGGTTGSILLDMFGGDQMFTAFPYFDFQNSAGTAAYGDWYVVGAGVKAHTLLFDPPTNGTLSNEPWGLKHYTGEQSFDLLVVNDTTTGQNLYSEQLVDPWGNSYSVFLAPGLNNLLVPRGQFLNSSFGSGVLLGTTLTQKYATTAPALLGSSELSTISPMGGSTDLEDLACYWQNFAISSNSGALCTGESGTTTGSSSSIRIVENDGSCSSTNCGGVPSDPRAENGSTEGAALQTVGMLNLSTQTQLDLLVAALLDNNSGKVNGSFLDISSQVGSMGFAKPILAALANLTQSSDGLYGSPTSVVPPPPPPSSGFWGAVWNAFAGFVSAVVNGIIEIASFVWTAVLAIATFVDHIVQGLAAFAESVVAATVTALERVGNALLTLLKDALDWIIDQAKRLFQAAFGPLAQLAKSFEQNIFNAFNAAEADQKSAQNITLGDATTLWDLIGGDLFQLGFTVAMVITIAITILSFIALGAPTVISIVVGILIGVVASLLIPTLVSTLGRALVFDVEGFVNTTDGPPQQQVPRHLQPAVRPLGNCTTSQQMWDTGADLYAWGEGGFTNTLALGDVVDEISSFKHLADAWDAKFIVTSTAFALGVISSVLTLNQLGNECYNGLQTVALTLGGLSVVLDEISIGLDAKDPASTSDDMDIDLVTLGLDTSTFEISLYQYLTGT